MALLESFDRFAGARNALRKIGDAAAEWAGIPMPIDGQSLVIEPSYPFASIFAKGNEQEDDATLRNIFWSTRHRRDIAIFEEHGKLQWCAMPGVGHLDHDLRTLGCSVAWGIEQEQRALKLLGEMVRHHTFKSYLLSGMFLESSKRSGVTYLFRRLKPTVALSTNGKHVKVLCALCMHPIAYYLDSWAGAMCPTDDVIAHLAMMRSDEVMLWRRCSQHAPHRPEAGL